MAGRVNGGMLGRGATEKDAFPVFVSSVSWVDTRARVLTVAELHKYLDNRGLFDFERVFLSGVPSSVAPKLSSAVVKGETWKKSFFWKSILGSAVVRASSSLNKTGVRGKRRVKLFPP